MRHGTSRPTIRVNGAKPSRVHRGEICECIGIVEKIEDGGAMVRLSTREELYAVPSCALLHLIPLKDSIWVEFL